MPRAHRAGSSLRVVVLPTGIFTFSFALWGLLPALLPILQADLALRSDQINMLIMLPLIVGSLLRLPAGWLADRLGPPLVAAVWLLWLVLPLWLLSAADSYGALLLGAALLGTAGALFSIGVSYLSYHVAPAQIGLALGLYGMGNAGYGLAGGLAPRLAQWWGVGAVFQLMGFLALVAAILFLLCSRPTPRRSALFSDEAVALLAAPATWRLSLWYLLGFGGFLTLGAYLPFLLSHGFGWSAVAAGNVAAAYALAMTAGRPIGGWLADGRGSHRVLLWNLSALALLSLGLAVVTGAALYTALVMLMALCMGQISGAVFRLVPVLRPEAAGALAGVVSCIGGLGGVILPLLFAVSLQLVQVQSAIWVLFAAAAAGAALLARANIGSDPVAGA